MILDSELQTSPQNVGFTGRTILQADAVTIEQYRKLALTLQRSANVVESRVVLITSALAGEGKSLTAANLALTLSTSYRLRVLLVDGDLRRPTVGRIFTERTLQSECAAIGMKVFGVNSQLSIAVPDGEGAADPISALNSTQMRTLIQWGRDHFDWVVIDSPPAALVPDSTILAPLAGGVLLVVRAGATPADAVRRAISGIGHERILGVVLNRIAEHHADGALQYYSQIRDYDGTGSNRTKGGM
jgi:protein-tyrosine kinase